MRRVLPQLPRTQKNTETVVTAPEYTEDAQEFVQNVLADRSTPVVMFALEWCEFCWSVRNMFKALNIPFRSIDLDSVAYQNGGKGQKIRAALNAHTGMKTIPQIFIGGELIGGCTELFDSGGPEQRRIASGFGRDSGRK